MAPPSRKRKGKEVAASPSFYSHRFRTKENEDHYNSVVNKAIIPEIGFALKEGEFPEIQAEIARRGWGLFCTPSRFAKKNLVLEFYANAWQPVKDEEAKFKSYIRGVEIDFGPRSIERVLNLETVLEQSPEGYCAQMEGEKNFQTIIRDICVPGANWTCDRSGRPNQLNRASLNPVAKGWLEFINHSILPTSHHTSVTTDRALMIHCLMTGEQVDLATILANAILKLAYSSRKALGFPGLIQRLAEAAGAVIEDDAPILMPKPITAATIVRLRKKDGREAAEVPPIPHTEAPLGDEPITNQKQGEQSELQELRADFDRFRKETADVLMYITHSIHRLDLDKFPECRDTCSHLWRPREPNVPNTDDDEEEESSEDEDQAGD